MQRRSLAVSSALLIVGLALTGCASPEAGGPGGTPIPVPSSTSLGGADETPAPVETSASAEPDTVDEAALTQAQAWLDAVNLPSGAVTVDIPTFGFNSHTGWPCGPYEQLKGYWMVPATTVFDVGNWLLENGVAGLQPTMPGPLPEDWRHTDGVSIGFIPSPQAQEGVVYTLLTTDEGVAVRAEVAAQTDTASCPPLPDGGMWGAPGSG